MRKKEIRTGANAREGVGVAEDGPEVEAIDGPKQRKKCEPELVEPPRVAHRLFLREPQWSIDRWPNSHRTPNHVRVRVSVRVGVVTLQLQLHLRLRLRLRLRCFHHHRDLLWDQRFYTLYTEHWVTCATPPIDRCANSSYWLSDWAFNFRVKIKLKLRGKAMIIGVFYNASYKIGCVMHPLYKIGCTVLPSPIFSSRSPSFDFLQQFQPTKHRVPPSTTASAT